MTTGKTGKTIALTRRTLVSKIVSRLVLKNLYAGQAAPDMEKQTLWKLGKEYVKAVYCHPAYLTCMQST